MSLKKLLKNWKILLLLTCVLLALVALHPNPLATGVAIRTVTKDSSAALAGIINPKPTVSPMSREVITFINNVPIKNIADYTQIVSEARVNSTIIVKTNKDIYKLLVRPKYNIITLNETELVEVTESFFNATSNTTTNITKEKLVNKTAKEYAGVEDIGLKVYTAPTSNIRMGLDLQGGTRVMLKPEHNIAPDEIDSLVENMKERLNVYGLSDIVVKSTSDLEGQNYILVEIAGATDQEVKDLISKQGKFEGKIGNDSVFKGGVDIKHVCRTADCSRIQQCARATTGYSCRFIFGITLSTDSAQRQGQLTKVLDTVIENGEPFLSKNLDLYLDDELVDSLRIGESLKGRSETEISISGSGSGVTQSDAMLDATNNMKRLQTILVTGSLPVKLNIVKTNNMSPTLGNAFLNNTILVGFLVLILVVGAIALRYRRLVVSIPIAITLISEVIILLGVASLIGWNIDLIAISGILIAIGTGVDSQLVIIDEITHGIKDDGIASSWKEKIKNAFFIVMASYFTLIVAMIPLLFAGAGLLKGFALTTMLGASIGVFITRPAFAVIAEELIRKEHH